MEVEVTPPASLVRYETPLFVGDRTAGKYAPDPKAGSTQIDEILNSILPPREWAEDTGRWMQYVSKTPSTRLDVITLQVNLMLAYIIMRLNSYNDFVRLLRDLNKRSNWTQS